MEHRTDPTTEASRPAQRRTFRSALRERERRRIRLLTTESSASLVQGMESALAVDAARVKGPALTVGTSPASVFERLSANDVDVFLVEVSATAANGAAWIAAVRSLHPALPIVAGVEREDPPSCTQALAAGADACLYLESLDACSILHAVQLAVERSEIRSRVRRPDPRAEEVRRLRFGSFELDGADLVLRKDGRPVPIHRTPLRLLIHLVRNAGRTVSRQELMETVWSGAAVSDCAVASALKELRRVLGDDGARQRLIETRRGIGYRFVGEIVPGAERGGQE